MKQHEAKLRLVSNVSSEDITFTDLGRILILVLITTNSVCWQGQVNNVNNALSLDVSPFRLTVVCLCNLQVYTSISHK